MGMKEFRNTVTVVVRLPVGIPVRRWRQDRVVLDWDRALVFAYVASPLWFRWFVANNL